MTLPLSYGIFISDRRGPPLRETGLFFLSGFTAGVVYSIIDKMIIRGISTGRYAFFPQFFFYFLSETFIPSLCALLVINLLVKGSADYRIRSDSSILFGFFSVFIVYRVLYRYHTFTPFLLFIKPLLYAAFIYISDVLSNRIAALRRKSSSASRYILMGFALLAVFIVPSICDTAWTLMYPSWIWLTLSLLYILAAAGLFIWKTCLSSEAPCGAYFISPGAFLAAKKVSGAEADLSAADVPVQEEIPAAAEPVSENGAVQLPFSENAPASAEKESSGVPRKKRASRSKVKKTEVSASDKEKTSAADVPVQEEIPAAAEPVSENGAVQLFVSENAPASAENGLFSESPAPGAPAQEEGESPAPGAEKAVPVKKPAKRTKKSSSSGSEKK